MIGDKRKIFKNIAFEIIFLMAIVLISYGIWQIYKPATYIFIGLCFGIPYVIKSMRESKGSE